MTFTTLGSMSTGSAITLSFWSIALIRLGAVLAATGFGPLALTLLFPGIDPLVPVFLSLTLGPAGLLLLLAGVAGLLIARLR